MEQREKDNEVVVEDNKSDDDERASGAKETATRAGAQSEITEAGGGARKASAGDSKPAEEKRERAESKQNSESVRVKETVKVKEEIKLPPYREELIRRMKASPNYRLTSEDITYLSKVYNKKRPSIYAYSTKIRKQMGWDTPKEKTVTKKKVVKKEPEVEKVVVNASEKIAEDVNKSTPKVEEHKKEDKDEKKEKKSIWEQWWFWLAVAAAGVAAIWLFRKTAESRRTANAYQNVPEEFVEPEEQPAPKEEKPMSDYERLILQNLNN